MANDENLGSINYTVDVDYSSLIKAGEAQDKFSDQSHRASKEVDRASAANKRLSSTANLAKTAITGLIGAMSVREIIRYADSWRSVENQLKQVTSGATQLEMVQSRLADVARETRSNFESTGNLYARLARSTEQMGLSTSELIGLTTTINQSFAASGATAEEAAAAITQLSQGLTSGALRGDEFNSVAEQAPGIMRAVAESLNMTRGELREFAAEGGITAEIIVRSLTEASDKIDKEFSKTVATFGQAMEVATTNVTQFVGESQSLSSAVEIAGSAIVGLTENIDTLIDIGATIAIAFGARAAGGLSAYAASSLAATRASIAQSAATAQATGAEVAFLKSVQGSLSAQLASAQTTTAQIAIRRQLAANTVALTAANNAYTTSLAASTAGARAATAAMGALRGAMALVGGPIGLAVLAAGSLYYFRDSLFSAEQHASSLTDELDKLTGSLNGLTLAQLENQRAQIAGRLREMREAASDLVDDLEKAEQKERQSNIMFQGRPGAASAEASKLRRQYQQLTGDILAAEDALATIDAQIERVGDSQSNISTTTEKLKTTYEDLISQLDPARAELNKYFDTIEAIGKLDVSQREKDRLRELAYEQHWKRMAKIADDGGKRAAEEFENPWQDTADRVAQSLQDAIASGDWDKIGDAIGNSLATSIAGIVNKTITDSLAKDLTSNSIALAQIGGAFAGPIAGAVAGGAIQLAVSELSDFFSGSDWDPTEARQAAQGTGTVLGSIDAKSESIAKAVDISAGASRELVGINRDMLRALQTLQIGIAGASGMVARSYGGLSMPADFTRTISGSDFDLTGGIMPIFDKTLGAAFDFFDGAFDVFSFGTFDLGGALGSVFGGSTKVKDIGIQFFGATLDEMIRGWRDGDRYLTAQAYASIKRDGGWFSSDKRWDEFQRLGPEAESQISLVFAGIRDSVTAGAEALGMSGTEIQSALDRFRVETQKISLENLSAEEQTAELEAVFSSIFDQAAAAVVPYLDDFQRAGEGLGETLARVATQVQVTEQAVDMLGLRFSDLAGAELIEASQRLIELGGGLDQFISSMQNFIGNFATEAQQFEINANALAQGMGDLPLPQTRDGFWALMQAQDAATAEGAENIATLLRLQGVADQYYSAIEKAQTSYYESEIQGQQRRLSEAQRANRAVQSAMDSMLFQSTAVQEASRQGALRTLEQIANAGRVTDIGQLQSALDAATQIDSGRYSTFADYAREFARTSGVVGRVGDVTQTAEDREARMLRSLENQLEAVKGMRDDLARSQLAIIKQTNKTAKTLERFEIDGIEVRS